MPRRQRKRTIARSPEILNVHMAAELLTVSVDTVYDLFKSGELPVRNVGRKWITTKAALVRWVEGSIENDAAGRALEAGDKASLTNLLQSSPVRLRSAAG